jgi:putative transposase
LLALRRLGSGHGKVLSRCRKRHRSLELCEFLSTVVKGRPEKQIHIILHNLSAHKTETVQAWLKAHPAVHLHYTPTYSSWLNQVEIWFGMITSQCIHRGTFYFRARPHPPHRLVYSKL